MVRRRTFTGDFISLIDANDNIIGTNQCLWDIVKNFFNDSEGIVSRRQLLRHCKRYGYTNYNSADTYRNYLYRAGYLTYAYKDNNGTPKRIYGSYILSKTIPTDLSVEDVKTEAYGGHPLDGKVFQSSSASSWSIKTNTYEQSDNFKPKDFINEKEFQV